MIQLHERLVLIVRLNHNCLKNNALIDIVNAINFQP